MEWYYDEGRKKNEKLDEYSEMTQAPYNPQKNKMYRNVCPICHKTLKNPCVLDTCGWVFCQNCIYSFVQKAKKCPKTHLSCSVDNIHRIYE